MAGGTLRVGLSAALHVLSGLAQTVCMQALLYSGGGDRSTLLLALPNYIGITLVYLVGRRCFRALDTLGVWAGGGKTSEVNRVHASMYAATVSPSAPVVYVGDGASGVGDGSAVQPPSSPLSPQHLSASQRLFHPERRKLFLLAFNEVGGFLAGLTGIAIAGSGLYQVVFSGGAVFTAVLSTIFLRKRLTPWQWIFVATITLGLMITAEQASSAAADAKPGAHAADIISGVAFVLVSCLFYSTNYVLAEHFLDHTESQNVDNDDPEQPPLSPILPPPNGLDLSMYTGGSCLVLFSIYIICHTIPNWNELVTSSIRRHHGNSKLILEQYIYITICSFLHSLSHYDVIATVGGT
jgi:EamA-like transporter family